MKNASEAEKLLSTSRKEAWLMSGQLRNMAYRFRSIASDVEKLTKGKWWEADASRAHFLSYCDTVTKLCANRADQIDTHDRVVIAELHQLAQMVRENDY